MNPRAALRPHFQSPASLLHSSLLLVFSFAAPAFSQATFPTPVLTSIAPLGGRPGGTIELTLRGTEVDDIREVLIGGRAVPVTPGQGKTWRVALPADLKPAMHDLRIVNDLGVSNPRAFQVSTHPEVASPGKNAAPEQAFKVPVNSVIDGVFKPGMPQWFSFEAKKGGSIVAGFVADRFDVRTEPMGTVLDAAGRELARMKNGVALFACPADGAYLLRLNELMHRGGDEYGFRVVLEHQQPVPARTSSSPPPGPPAALKIGDMVKDRFPEAGQARVFDLPVKAGDKVVIEARSHQLGHPSDPHLFIETLKPDGTYAPLAQVADAPAITPAASLIIPNRDPLHAYEAKADGVLRISLNDNFNTTSPFELSVRAAPGSPPRLVALNATLPSAAARKAYDVGTANVCRGGLLALEVFAPGRHAFSDAVELKAASLPKGVTCLGGFLGRGQSLGCVVFQAAADAPAGAALIDTVAESAYVQYAVADAARDQVLIRRTGPPAIGVSTLVAPALVMTEAGGILEVAVDGKLDIPLKITRQADFQDALKLKVMGLVEAAKAPEADIAAKAGAGKLTLDLKTLKLAPGEYGFILQGPAKAKFRRHLEALAQAEAEVKKRLGDHQEAQKQLDAVKAGTSADKVKLVATATAALKAAAAAKTAGDKAVKDLAAKAAPKEATFIVCSNPIRIRVKAEK